MIVVKERSETEELKMFRFLNLRMELTSKDVYYYSNLEKGFDGERKFDLLVKEHLDDHWIAINDLLLECNNSIFQIDSLLINYDTIFIHDVKNFDGDYIIKEDKWYSVSGHESSDPLDQLKRCESLLRRLLHHLGFSFPIESHLVFINPSFFLYHAPHNLSLVFLPQLNRYITQLKNKSGQLKGPHFKLAQKLVSMNLNISPFKRTPSYTYAQLKKGVSCRCGHAFMDIVTGNILICKVCGLKEDVDTAVLRNVNEFTALFPERKITTNAIHEWCKVINSTKTIRRILTKNFELIGNTRAAYFVETEKDEHDK